MNKKYKSRQTGSIYSVIYEDSEGKLFCSDDQHPVRFWINTKYLGGFVEVKEPTIIIRYYPVVFDGSSFNIMFTHYYTDKKDALSFTYYRTQWKTVDAVELRWSSENLEGKV